MDSMILLLWISPNLHFLIQCLLQFMLNVQKHITRIFTILDIETEVLGHANPQVDRNRTTLNHIFFR